MVVCLLGGTSDPYKGTLNLGKPPLLGVILDIQSDTPPSARRTLLSEFGELFS